MKNSRRLGVAVMLALVGGVVGVTPVAEAQMVVSATSSIGGPRGGGGQVSKASLDRYAEALRLDDGQKDIAKTLYEGYAEAFKAAVTERRDQTTALMRSMEETGDRTVFQEKMPEVGRTYKERTDALESSFMGDLKALLSADQAGAWPKVERMRRREVGLTRGGLAGESVDLTEVARNLNLKGDGLAETLEQYEVALDRALQERLAANEKFTDLSPAGGRMNMERMQEMMAASRESGEKIRDINQSYARRLESSLPEGDRPVFSAEFRRRSFPQVYREPYTRKLYTAAKGFADVSGDERAQIEADQASYERELEMVNEMWADAVLEAEKDRQRGAFTSGGQMLQMHFGEEPQALVDARKARRELDEKYRERLTGRLNKDQQDRLPKREDEQGGGHLEGAFMVIEEDR